MRLRKPSPRFLIGSGKAEEIKDLAHKLECTLVIFDDELSPAQQRNWEKLTQLPVIDRNEVILDIFAQRAHTKEATLQVELAKLEYMIPRLRRAWTHLHRQRGGGAVQRGDGETQLEIDQRLVRKRISQLKRELKEVIQHRAVQRQKRLKIPIPTGAIVGYTNAGKSSLLNCLTGACALVQDKLFATLDPKTRKLELPTKQTLLLTDTVGFVRKLPHNLIEAFKATLEEAVVSDFLIHVIDISNPDAQAHFDTTIQVLKELGAAEKPTITIFNKCDKEVDIILKKTLYLKDSDAIEASTLTKSGVDTLLERIDKILSEQSTLCSILIPHHRYDLINLLHEESTIKEKKTTDEGVLISAAIPARLHPTIKPFLQ